MIAQTKKPYEFLARWDDAGNLRGAHVIFREAVTDAGVEISSKIGEATPVGDAGFPLADILSTLSADALKDAAEKTTKLAEMSAEKTVVEASRASSEEHVTSITAQLAAVAAERVTIVAARDEAQEHVSALRDKVTDLTAKVSAADSDKASAVSVLTEQVAALTAQLAVLQPTVDAFSRKSIKVALSDASLLDTFEAVISDPQDSEQKLAMISWQEDAVFTKTSPALVLTFDRMKLTEEQISALFSK